MQMSAYCMENRSLFACKRQLAIVEIKIEMYQILSYELILLNGLLAAGMIVHMQSVSITTNVVSSNPAHGVRCVLITKGVVWCSV